MAQQKGSSTTLMLGWESVADGTVATDGFVLPYNTFNVTGSRTKNTPATITGNRNPVQPFAGNYSVSGSIVVPVDSAAMLYWMKACFGSASVDDSGAPTVYVHEYKISSTMPSFSLETGFTDLASDRHGRYVGCKVQSFSIDTGGDGEYLATFNIAAFSDSLAESAFDSEPTTITLARINNFNAAITEGGSAYANAKNLSFNVDFGLDTSQYLIGNSGVLGSLPEGIVGVSGNLKTTFLNHGLLTKAIASTESKIKLTATASTTSVFEIECEEIEYAPKSVAIPGPQGLDVDLDFQGFYTNGSEESAIVVRISNAVASAV